jgi:hypothetical protein
MIIRSFFFFTTHLVGWRRTWKRRCSCYGLQYHSVPFALLAERSSRPGVRLYGLSASKISLVSVFNASGSQLGWCSGSAITLLRLMDSHLPPESFFWLSTKVDVISLDPVNSTEDHPMWKMVHQRHLKEDHRLDLWGFNKCWLIKWRHIRLSSFVGDLLDCPRFNVIEHVQMRYPLTSFDLAWTARYAWLYLG